MVSPKKIDEPSPGEETEREELNENGESDEGEETNHRFLRRRAPRGRRADSSELWDLHAVETAGHSSQTPTYKCRYCLAGGRWTRNASENDFFDHLLSGHYKKLFMPRDQADQIVRENEEHKRIIQWWENVTREREEKIESLGKEEMETLEKEKLGFLKKKKKLVKEKNRLVAEKNKLVAEKNKLVEEKTNLEKADAEKTKLVQNLVRLQNILIAGWFISILVIHLFYVINTTRGNF